MSAGSTSALGRAKDAWGEDMPDWIKALAEACDRTSQAKAASEMGYTPAVVSTLLRRAYNATDLSKVESAVRGAFLSQTVECPVLLTISSARCIAEQRKSFSATNHVRVRLFRECHRPCPNFKKGN